MPDLNSLLMSFIPTSLVALLAAVLSYAAGKGMKNHEWKLNLLREKVAIRQRVYVEFLAEAEGQILRSIDAKSDKATSFLELSRVFSGVQLISSDVVVAAASAIYEHIIQSHAASEKTKAGFYGLKQTFIYQARKEIAGYEK